MQTKHEIKSVIKAARKKTGLSQMDFGRLLKVHGMTVSKYERGQLKVPTNYFQKCKFLTKTPSAELSALIKAFNFPPIVQFLENRLHLSLVSAS